MSKHARYPTCLSSHHNMLTRRSSSWSWNLHQTSRSTCYKHPSHCFLSFNISTKPELHTTFRLTHHMDIWWRNRTWWQTGNVRGEKQMRRTKERNGWSMHALYSSTDFCHSQQHVLLVLLENRSDVLEYLRCKQVYSTVDYVTHECAGFLHIMQYLENTSRIFIVR